MSLSTDSGSCSALGSYVLLIRVSSVSGPAVPCVRDTVKFRFVSRVDCEALGGSGVTSDDSSVGARVGTVGTVASVVANVSLSLVRICIEESISRGTCTFD